MANGKSEQELEQIAKNLCQQRGINLDEAKNQFAQMFNQRNNRSPYDYINLFYFQKEE